jgi:hypothetical protein
MKANTTILLVSLLFCYCTSAFCYFDEYPPYRFKDGQPKHLKLEPLVSLDKAEYKSKDSKIAVRLKETSDTLDFVVQDEGKVLVKMNVKDTPLPDSVYQYDIDGNGLKDFIVFYSYRGCGLAAFYNKVEIYLKQNNRNYQKIYFDTMCSGLDDFVDLSNDGEYKLIITGFYGGKKHNYFTYNIYEFSGGKLVNADAKVKGFPKFIWYTNKRNDKDTKHVSPEERTKHTEGKNNSIEYEIVK